MKKVDITVSFRADGKGYDKGKHELPDDVAKVAIKEGWAKEIIIGRPKVNK